MAIKKIKIANFKSFKNLEVELGNFNVVIGANAAGKSNFMQIFKFLKDIIQYGLDNAISLQGDIAYLRNIIIGPSENLLLEVSSDSVYRRVLSRKKDIGPIGMKVDKTLYNFILKFNKRGSGYEIAGERLEQKFDLVKLDMQQKKIEEKETVGKGEIVISRVNDKINIETLKLPQELSIKEDDIIPSYFKEERLGPKTLFLNSPFVFLLPPYFSGIAIYDFDPKLPKKATPITGKAELEEDGSNLSIVLNHILKHKERERKLSNLIKDLLPFVDKIDVEKFADKSLLFKLKEIFHKKQYLPASLVSDGTINITALIVSLYFEKKPLTIIEEPERNIHPSLISKMVEMMKDASQNKQIIVTTHNPQMVKHAGLENILLISRDKDGYSTIHRPSDREAIKTFLKKEMELDDLYVQNLLEL